MRVGSDDADGKPGEVVALHSRIKPDSSLGPNGVTKEILLRWNPYGTKLFLMFNSWLVAGFIPSQVKSARTVVLSKCSDAKALAEAGNWRLLFNLTTDLVLHARENG